METENFEPEAVPQNRLKEVTPVSKYLALALFIILPFVGGWIGYKYGTYSLHEGGDTELDNSSTSTPADASNQIINAKSNGDVSNLDFLPGTYAVVRSRHVEDNEWFDTSVLVSTDRGFTWDRYTKIHEGYIPGRAYVLYDTLYYSVVEGMSSATNTTSHFFSLDLRTKDITALGSVDGYFSDFGVTPQGILALVPHNRFCLDKATNCTSDVIELENGQVNVHGTVQGIWLEAYGHRGVITRGGYGDAGCASTELYHYQREASGDLTLLDEYLGSVCADDGLEYSTYGQQIEDKVNSFSQEIDSYYAADEGNTFAVDKFEPLRIAAKDTEVDRMNTADPYMGSTFVGEVMVLSYPDITNGAVSQALKHFRAEAQTDIPDFNLDEDAYPRDMLYPDGGGGKYMQMSEVYQFNTPEQCLVVYNNAVHDITALLRLEHTFPTVKELSSECGTDVSDYIANMPVQTGSLNTARFAYAMSEFWIGYWVER